MHNLMINSILNIFHETMQRYFKNVIDKRNQIYSEDKEHLLLKTLINERQIYLTFFYLFY